MTVSVHGYFSWWRIAALRKHACLLTAHYYEVAIRKSRAPVWYQGHHLHLGQHRSQSSQPCCPHRYPQSRLLS